MMQQSRESLDLEGAGVVRKYGMRKTRCGPGECAMQETLDTAERYGEWVRAVRNSRRSGSARRTEAIKGGCRKEYDKIRGTSSGHTRPFLAWQVSDAITICC